MSVLLAWTAAEWGVLQYDCEKGWKISAGPKEPALFPVFHGGGGGGEAPVMKEPVLYIYGDLPGPVSFRILVHDSAVVYAQPIWDLHGKMPEWTIGPSDAMGVGGFPYFDADATLVTINHGGTYAYLLYEMKLRFYNTVVAIRVPGGMVFFNAGPHPVKNIYYLGEDSWFGLDELGPGKGALAHPQEGKPESGAILQDMKEEGFTEGASKAFADHWWPTVSNKPGSLFYLVSRDQADELVPVEWSPVPEKFTRAFWIWHPRKI